MTCKTKSKERMAKLVFRHPFQIVIQPFRYGAKVMGERGCSPIAYGVVLHVSCAAAQGRCR